MALSAHYSDFEHSNQFKGCMCLAWTWFLTLSLTIPTALTQKCSYNKEHTFVNCSNRNLDYVPYTLHKNINKLDLSGNLFPKLENASFINYRYITELYLRNNSIKEIQVGAFQELIYLRTLDLSSNQLTQIPSSALNHLAGSLLQLILSGNNLYTIPSGAFAKLKDLRHLDLSGNRLHRIGIGAFSGLKALEVFKIHHNALKTLHTDAFQSFYKDLKQVQLYDNRWLCDCRIRWLRTWLNDTDRSVWETPGYYIRCDEPAFVRDKALDLLPMDELACKVHMKTSGSIRELDKGANTTLFCKYVSVPEAEAQWKVNSEVVDAARSSGKYNVTSSTVVDTLGYKTQTSELRIKNFQHKDIAKYECAVQNIRGTGTTEYRLTLKGVDFNSVVVTPPVGPLTDEGVNTFNVVIAVAVVCGIILLVVIAVLIFCSVNWMQRKQQEKRDAIVENVKNHFIINSESGNVTQTLEGKKPERLSDGHSLEDLQSDSPGTHDTTLGSLRRPPHPEYEESEPLYIFEQPGSPSTNGNTYVSFGSELTDPGEFPNHVVPQPSYKVPNGRYEAGSHAGSATPLLDRYTPSVFDSDEPIEDYAQYPVYDSLTKSLHHPIPRRPTNGNYQSNEGIYGYSTPTSLRHGSNSSYPNGNGPAFQYSTTVPRTPGSVRSNMAPSPRHMDDIAPSPRHMDGSPPIVDSQTLPQHARHMPNYNQDYRDYREMRYPATTPPPNRMSPSKKSMSVGNLGFTPLQASTGPRKPPRIYQSREYLELTPHDNSSDYITSPEAQQYSQSYGITPGTPV